LAKLTQDTLKKECEEAVRNLLVANFPTAFKQWYPNTAKKSA
jgi:hypothetical protein